MRDRSEIIEPTRSPDFAVLPASAMPSRPSARHRRTWIEIILVFGFILGAVWIPPGVVNSFFVLVASACVVGFAATGTWGLSELGLTRPKSGAHTILLTGAGLCLTIAFLGIFFRFAGHGYVVSWSRSLEYVVWASLQEFILQAIFYLRVEAVLGSRRAVYATAFLFALTHIPNAILTGLAFLGGILFCEFFRRYRNLYPIGLIHGALGLTIAASLPDRWLHHMRVGIGYLHIHP